MSFAVDYFVLVSCAVDYFVLTFATISTEHYSYTTQPVRAEELGRDGAEFWFFRTP